MSKGPRFFCDNCSAEVGHSAKSCPNCGRFFESVRCPSCNFVGDENTFAKGCPVCGYSTSPAKAKATKPAHTKERSQRLPFWVLFISVGVFVLAFAILFMLLL